MYTLKNVKNFSLKFYNLDNYFHWSFFNNDSFSFKKHFFNTSLSNNVGYKPLYKLNKISTYKSNFSNFVKSSGFFILIKKIFINDLVIRFSSISKNLFNVNRRLVSTYLIMRFSETSTNKYINLNDNFLKRSNYVFFFLRKNKIFNKGRYSRNRQTYRTGFY